MALFDRFRKEPEQTSLTPEQVDAVVGFLGYEFNHDEFTRNIIRKTVVAHDLYEPFEVILDDPGRALWRLKPDRREHPLGLRVGFHGMPAFDESREKMNRDRQDFLCDRLDEIVTGVVKDEPATEPS